MLSLQSAIPPPIVAVMSVPVVDRTVGEAIIVLAIVRADNPAPAPAHAAKDAAKPGCNGVDQAKEMFNSNNKIKTLSETVSVRWGLYVLMIKPSQKSMFPPREGLKHRHQYAKM